MPQSKLVFFLFGIRWLRRIRVLRLLFFASHPLVAKFLGVRGYFT
ncbi:hypothetical protein [Campylobacter magnus]|uniref:Uncharacterized protein n=1 Tax=Campylobacter magnus TaxID=3026462 RepID=A0ABT8T734_9BACT|nr:hypothetical protein [Campylobacter magnus]MDO2409442.1 hypothetical protein [Campylobacter magnus]